MVTIQIKKVCDFDARPELDEARQTFNALESLIANHRDTVNTGNQFGCFLVSNASIMKRGNLSGIKFEESQKEDEGNRILETRVSVHPKVLIMHINLNEIGITEGRGSYEIRPEENGLWLQAQEVECYKNSENEEAHAVKRKVLRNYTVNGSFDWKTLTSTLMPDGTLYIAVSAKCYGQLAFPSLAQETTYSSLPCKRPDFPTCDYQTFGTFANSCSVFENCDRSCWGMKSVAAQTGSSLNCSGASSSTQTWDSSPGSQSQIGNCSSIIRDSYCQ